MPEYAALSVRGNFRSDNEDVYSVTELRDDTTLFILCDGIGGHAAGKYAADRAVTLAKYLLSEKARSFPYNIAPESVAACFRETVAEINRTLYEEAEKDPSRRGMGTTFLAVLLLGNRVTYASVGDSRLSLRSGDRLRHLTHPHRDENGALTRAIGVSPSVVPDTGYFRPRGDFAFLLASDGLYAYCPDRKLSSLLQNAVSPQNALSELVSIAEKESKDNMTGIVCLCRTEERSHA